MDTSVAACFRWIRGCHIALTLLSAFHAARGWAIEELESIQPGRYAGQWGSRMDNEAVYEIVTVQNGIISGRVRIVEAGSSTPAGAEFGFRLEKGSPGDWHFTWENPPVEVVETFKAQAYPTPQGLLVGAFYRDAEEGPCSAGFWLDPNLTRHPKHQIQEDFIVSGELRMTAKVYTSGDGLASNAGRCGIQSSDGYVWIGTISGLSRFDGVEWVNFTPSNSAIPEENITGLTEDQEGRLILSTKGSGLFYVEDEGHRYVPFSANASLMDRWIKDPKLGTDGSVWFIYDREKSLGRIDPQGELHYWELEDLGLAHPYSPDSGRHLNDVEPAPDGKVVVTSNQGTVLFDPHSGGTFIPGGNFNWRSQVESFGEGQWVVSGQADLRFSRDHFRTFVRRRLPDEFHPCLGADADSSGGLWVRVNNGLLNYDPSSNGLVRVAGIPEDIRGSIGPLFEDKEGGLWIVSHSHGVVRLKRNFVRMLTDNSKPSGDNEWRPAMLDSSQERIHLASIKSIDVLNQDGQPEPLTELGITHPIPWLRYMGLAFSHEPSQESTLWVSLNLPEDKYTKDLGSVPVLMRWDPIARMGEFVHYPGYPKGSEDFSSMVVRGREVWMANGAGAFIHHIETGEWTVWHQSHGLPPFPINTLSLDARKNLWLGSEGGGLFRESPEGDLDNLTTRDGLVSNTVLCMFEDPEGTQWVGSPTGFTQIDSTGKVVARFDKGPFHQLSILAITEDHRKRLWLGTNHGIVVVSRDELQRYHLGQIPEPRMARIGSGDGLANETVFGDYFPAACRGADGQLYFCMQNGIACIDPASAPSFDEGPNVQITGAFTIHETPLSIDRPFPPMAQDFLRIDYKAIAFNRPDKTRYHYRLLGHSDEWKDIGPQRQFLFPGLDPGGYQFEVKAYNMRGTVSPQIATLPFTIEPYPHQTWWFRVGILLMAFGVIQVFHRYQLAWRQRTNALQKKLELEEERSRIARDIHDEIGTSLAQILMLGQLAERNHPNAVHSASKIHSLARHCSQSLREIIWSLDPQNNQFDNLKDYMRHQVDRTLEDTGIRRVYHFNSNKLDFKFSPTINRQLILILKGILSNVLKHAQATEFELRLTLDHQALRMDTRDNGQGFDPMHVPLDSLGLTAMRERAAKLGGSLHIDSMRGQGCHTTLTIPLDPPTK